MAGAGAPCGRRPVQVNRLIGHYFGEATRDCCGCADQACRAGGRIPSVSSPMGAPRFLSAARIVLLAFAALGHGLEPNLLENPVITTIAQRGHKTPAQVALAWAIQSGTAVLT